jgi:hypothetical protein
MMEAQALVSLCALIALAFLFYGPWQKVCGEIGAHGVLEKRDEIFDLAMAGELDFDSEVYRTIRRSLESLATFAQEVTWIDVSLCALICFRWFHIPSQPSRLCRAIESIEHPDTRRKVKSITDEASAVVTATMAVKSIFFTIPVGAVWILIAFCGYRIHKIIRRLPVLRRVGRKIEFEAEEYACAMG